MCQNKSKFVNFKVNIKFLGQKIGCPIIFVRTTMLDSQPVTVSVILGSSCNEAFHRTMLQ